MSAAPEAFTVFQDFPPEEAKILKVDRHYLLYAAKGAMRLEAEGRSWSLPPARAALLRAGEPIKVFLPQKMTVCSALFSPEFAPMPPAALRVFDMSALARELVLECRPYGADGGVLDGHARQLFRTLQAVTWKLAETPSPASIPVGKSPALIRALSLTEEMLSADPSFADIAIKTGQTPRSLARRFAEELGMTWRQALREMRMIRAIEALAASDASITEVGFAVGYNSLSAFNAAFRDFTGRTPRDYRASFRTNL